MQANEEEKEVSLAEAEEALIASQASELQHHRDNRAQRLGEIVVERINAADVVALDEAPLSDDAESVQKSERFNKVMRLDSNLLRSIDRSAYREEEEKIMPPKNRGGSLSMNAGLERGEEDDEEVKGARRRRQQQREPPSPSDSNYQTIQQTNNFVREDEEEDASEFRSLKRRLEQARSFPKRTRGENAKDGKFQLTLGHQ